MTSSPKPLRRPLLVLLPAALAAAYPFAVYASLGRVPAGALAVVALALATARLAALRGVRAAGQLAPPLGVVVAAMAALSLLDAGTAVLAYPVLMSVAFAAAFGLSLRRGPSLVEVFASLAEPAPSPAAKAYMRKVTWVWFAFLLGNAAVAAATTLDMRLWTWWNGLVSYLLMGLLFAVEWMVRPKERFTPLSRLLPAGRPDDWVVAVGDGGAIPFARFRADVAACAAQVRGTRRAGLVCRDSYAFAVQLLGLWQAGATVVLPPNAQPGTLAALAGEWELLLGDELPEDGAFELHYLDPAACILEVFTSGSTGAPKRVVRPLEAIEGEATALHALWGDGPGTVLSTVSHQHAYGLAFRLCWPLMAGRPFAAASHELCEPLLAECPEGAVVVSSPAHLSRLTGLPAAVGRRPRLLLSAGAPLPPTAAAEARRVFGIAVTEIYGSTETGAVAWRQGPEPWRPLPGNRFRTGDDGRLELLSPYVAPDWVETGDRAEMQGEGFQLLGRTDRVAKIGGKRVALAEVEAALAASPLVADAQVAVLDGTLVAAVVASPAGAAELAALGAFRFGRLLRRGLSATLEPTACPRRWRFVPEIPSGALGKRQDATVTALFAEADYA